MALDELWNVGQLAKQTGLTVRTLHHYDEIGLLKPTRRDRAGRRFYSVNDIARLQQVISLRQLGFSLEETRDCLDRPGFAPLTVVNLHIAKLREQIAMQRKLCNQLEAIAAHLQVAETVSANEFFKSIQVMTMLNSMYTPEQMKQFEEVGKLVGPEEIEAVQNGWTDLLAQVRANLHLDPASPEAQALAARWDQLTEQTMRGYQGFPELKQAIGDNYKQGKFEGFAGAPQAADLDFIARVKQAKGS